VPIDSIQEGLSPNTRNLWSLPKVLTNDQFWK